MSTASLVLGVAAASSSHNSILITGIAGLVAGAMSMAAGEYVSVQSQADAEAAALALEKSELRDMPDSELAELTQIRDNPQPYALVNRIEPLVAAVTSVNEQLAQIGLGAQAMAAGSFHAPLFTAAWPMAWASCAARATSSICAWKATPPASGFWWT